MSPRSRLSLALLFGLGILSSFVVLGAAPSRNDPMHAPFIDNQPHTVEANSDTWLKFDYGLNGVTRSVVTLDLVDGATGGVHFEVWSPEIIGEWWQNKPTGQGTIPDIDCSTGQIVGSSACQSKDLTWSGAFGGAGTYYVRVVNTNPTPSPFLLTIAGDGVTLGPPAENTPASPVVAVQATSTPTVTPVPAGSPVFTDDPFQAIPIDGVTHIIPGNSATWYKFDYAANAETRPIVNLRLPNGVVTGVGFEIWEPDKIRDFWEQKPVGRGTQEVVTNCTPPVEPTAEVAEGEATPTPEAAPGDHCPTNDLTWKGAFGGSGTFYVRVVNPTSSAADYVLVLY